MPTVCIWWGLWWVYGGLCPLLPWDRSESWWLHPQSPQSRAHYEQYVVGWGACQSWKWCPANGQFACIAAKRGCSNDYVTFPLCMTCDYMGTNRPTPFSTLFSYFNSCMLQLANMGVKGRIHICIQHVLYTYTYQIWLFTNSSLYYHPTFSFHGKPLYICYTPLLTLTLWAVAVSSLAALL